MYTHATHNKWDETWWHSTRCTQHKAPVMHVLDATQQMG
jgi:hypothetical protein